MKLPLSLEAIISYKDEPFLIYSLTDPDLKHAIIFCVQDSSKRFLTQQYGNKAGLIFFITIKDLILYITDDEIPQECYILEGDTLFYGKQVTPGHGTHTSGTPLSPQDKTSPLWFPDGATPPPGHGPVSMNIYSIEDLPSIPGQDTQNTTDEPPWPPEFSIN